MSKTASQRRFEKRASDLGELRSSDSPRFVQMWNTLCRGWVGEIHARARAWRLGTSSDKHKGVFDVYDCARRLACAAGAEHQRLVIESLIALKHLCSQAVAHSTDPRLYQFGEDCTSRVRRCARGEA